VASAHVRPSVVWLFLCPLAVTIAQPLRLASPHDGAHPRTSYVALAGEAAPSAHLAILDGPAVADEIQSDALGHFECILRLSAGAHQLSVRSAAGKFSIQLEIAANAAPSTSAPYESMQTGDVILAHDRNSQQDALYQPVYTHAALYVGPDGEGNPQLLEAVPEDIATRRGPIAIVPIQESVVWLEADRLDIFRPTGGLQRGDRARIVDWARRTAARGLPFRTNELGDLYRAWLLWDPVADKPRDEEEFASIVNELRDRLQASDSYDCATLVWHAYLDNTSQHIDLAAPNRVTWRGAAVNESPRFRDILHPLVILPDSFALSGKLRRVGQ
jgi:hypothetical protein